MLRSIRNVLAISTLLACGTALAADDNAPRSDPQPAARAAVQPTDDAQKGSLDINAWVVPSNEYGRSGGDIPGNVYVGRVDFVRSGTYQNLHANVQIPYCSGGFGQACQKRFAFQLTCRDAYGNTTTVMSPYFRNYATYGQWQYRDYSFSDPSIQYCDNIDYIQTFWVNGW